MAKGATRRASKLSKEDYKKELKRINDDFKAGRIDKYECRQEKIDLFINQNRKGILIWSGIAAAVIALGLGLGLGLGFPLKNKSDKVNEQGNTIQKQQDEIDKLKNQQTFEIDETTLATIKANYMQDVAGEIAAYDSFTYQAGKLTLYFTGKSEVIDEINPLNSKMADAVFALTLNAPEATFKTEDVMRWLQEQVKKENVAERPQAAVFLASQDLGLEDANARNMLVQLSSKKKDAAEKQLSLKAADAILKGETYQVEEGAVEFAGNTFLSIEKSKTPDMNGNYKVIVKGVSKNIDGKWVMDEVSAQPIVEKGATQQDIVGAGVKAYCDMHEIKLPTASADVEAE